MTGEQTPDTLTLQLVAPVEFAGVTYESITLTEPTIAQLRKAEKAGSSLDQIASLISLNAAVPAGMVDRLRQRDMEAAADFFGRFGARTTTPSAT